MNPWSLVGLADLHAAAIDHDGSQLDRRISSRDGCHQGACLVGPGSRCLFVDPDAPLFLAEGLEVARGDLEPDGDADQFRGLSERASGDGRRDDDGSNRWAVAAMIQALAQSIGGKRPAGIASNSAAPL